MSFPPGAIRFPPNVFGLQDTSAGLITFGSLPTPNQVSIAKVQRSLNVAIITTATAHGLIPGDTVTTTGITVDATFNASNVVVLTTPLTTQFTYVNNGTDTGLLTETTGYMYSALPAGVTYQRLLAPSSATYPALASIVYSCNFSGKAFVIAKFADNSVLMYYDGSPVTQNQYGRVLNYSGAAETITQLSIDLFNAIVHGGINWPGSFNTDFNTPGYQTPFVRAGCTVISSPIGVHFNPVVAVTSSAGILTPSLIDSDYAGIAQTSAIASFQLNAPNTGTVAVAAPSTSAGVDLNADLTNGTVAVGATLGDTAIAVANAININGATLGYYAKSKISPAAIVTVYAPLVWGASPNNWLAPNQLQVTCAGGITDSTALNLTLALSASGFPSGTTAFSNIVHGTSGFQQVTIGINATATGGQSPYTITWAPVNQNGIIMTNTLGAVNTFTSVLFFTQDLTGTFSCTVVDGGAVTIVINFSVRLAFLRQP